MTTELILMLCGGIKTNNYINQAHMMAVTKQATHNNNFSIAYFNNYSSLAVLQ